MILFLTIWVALLHMGGAILFFHLIDTIPDGAGKKKTEFLFQVPGFVRVIILCFWPYIMIFWLLFAEEDLV